jgi:predicted O-linked N-acetylglucosamine transferase (SPINDLY family)
MGLLGLRPAPIQVSWKNFVGSLGADGYVGHLVGDAIVTPPELQGHYSERLFLLPVIHRFSALFLFRCRIRNWQRKGREVLWHSQSLD